MRRARPVLAVTLLGLAILGPTRAAAHPTDAFDACLTRADVDICDDTFSYLFGDVVVLKATVSPLHEEAVVQRRAPGSNGWENVGTVSINDAGR